MIEFCQTNDLVICNKLRKQNMENKFKFVANNRNAKSLKKFLNNIYYYLQNTKWTLDNSHHIVCLI